MAGHRALDAYVCYAVADTSWVRGLAGYLHEADLEVLLDPWAPEGADVVALRIAEGTGQTRCSLLVYGPGAAASGWVLDRFQAMLSEPDARRNLIAVRYGEGAPPTPEDGLDARRVDFSDLDAAGFEERVADLVRAIGPSTRSAGGAGTGGAGTGGAGTGTGTGDAGSPGRGRRIPSLSASLRIGTDHVSCVVANDMATTAGIAVDGHGFSTLLWSHQRHDSEALRAIGTALGATFTADPVGRILEDAASEAYALGTTLNVGIASGDDLGDLPWEALILPGRSEPLALHPATRIYRAYDATGGIPSTMDPATGPTPASSQVDALLAADIPGPLRILAMVANPDGSSLVDYERELAAVMDAVEPARKYHGARVRILNEGTLAAITAALAEERFHVLHVSCFARPGALLFEDGDGRAAVVSAEALRAAIPAGRDVPLVVLTGGWSAHTPPGTEALPALARRLIAAGVPQVLAMTAPVTDRYAAGLCADLYRELALAARPDALAALAHARRDAEASRLHEAASTGRPGPAEWATPALHLRGLPAALYDPALYGPALPAGLGASQPRQPTFVGRRDEVHRLTATLRQPAGPAFLLYGIGGVGKSALVAEAVRRLDLAADTGADTGADAGAGAGAATSSGRTRLVSLHGVVTADEFQYVTEGGHRTLLVLDGMEANLVRSGDDAWVLADPDLAGFLSGWAQAPGRGRLVMISRDRFELPGLHPLWTHHLGPLTWSETRSAMWHLRALDTLSSTDQHKSYVDAGGNPRTLEIIDALLRQPGVSFTELRQRMQRLLLDRRIDRPELWMAQVGKDGMDASLAEAVTLAVRRGLLSDLLGTLDKHVRSVLLDIAAHQTSPAAPVPISAVSVSAVAVSAVKSEGDRYAAVAELVRLRLATEYRSGAELSYVVDPDTVDVASHAFGDEVQYRG